MPSICGMLMSISTRAGLSSSASWTASVPVDASPASSKPSSRRSTALAAARNGAWSSTTRTASRLVTALVWHAGHRRPRVVTTGPGCGQHPRAGLGVALLAEVDQDRLDPAVHVLLLRQGQLGEDRVGVLLDGPLSDEQARGDGRVTLALGHLGEEGQLAGGQGGPTRPPGPAP